MPDALTTQSIEGFYQRWSPRAFAFARHMFGDDAGAEHALQEAFRAYAERDLPSDQPEIPAFLFLFVLDGARKSAPQRTITTENPTLPEALLGIPVIDRAVFILRSVMDWDELLVGEIVELPVHEVRKRWIQALRAIRALMKKQPNEK